MINGSAILTGFAAATLLNPFLMFVTAPIIMEKRGTLKQYFKMTGILALVTVVAVLLEVFVILNPEIVRPRLRFRLTLVVPIAWFGIMKANATYLLEKEEVDENMLLFQYGALIVCGYYAMAALMGPGEVAEDPVF